MADRNDETATRRVVSAELLIATFALLASAIASVATIFQTRTIGNQLSASVWPYLTAATTIETGRRDAQQLGFGFTNQGLGPALVRTYVVSVDGRAVRTWAGALARARLSTALHEDAENDFGAGSVIRPGETIRIVGFAVRGSQSERTLQAQADRFTSTVCYCSLLHNCWTLASAESEPRPVGTCGAPTKPVTQ